jgi:hypothetical protein
MHSEGGSERVREALSRAMDMQPYKETLPTSRGSLSVLFMYYRWNFDINAALQSATLFESKAATDWRICC